MAAKFRKVDPRIWHDEKFSRLSSEDKLLAMYCLTSGQTNRIGYYHLSIAMMAEQTGYPPDTLRKGIRRVCHTLKWCFDDASNVLFLPSWWKYNGACGPKTMAGNLQDLHDVPQSQLLEQFKAECRYLSEQEFDVLTRVCDTHAIPMPYPSAFGAQEQEQEKEQEQEQEKKIQAAKPRCVFEPPTVEQVTEYCRERGNGIDPQAFVAFYSAKGWMIGKNKMKDWRAAVITWERNQSNGKHKPEESDAMKRLRQIDERYAQQKGSQ